MDKIVADWKRNHTDIYTETSHRIRRQPSRSDAASYEDLGQSGFHASGSRKGNDTKRSTSGNKNRKQSSRKDDGSGDSDELNISETSGVDSGGESSRHGKANGEGGSEVLQAQDHVENARERGKVLKALKFKKKGRTEAGDETPVKANQGSDSSRTHTSRPSTSQSSETSQPHTGGSRSTVVAKKSRSGTTTVILSDEEEEAEPPNGYKEKEKRAKDRTNKRRARSRSGSKSPERAAHRKPRAFPMSPRQTTPVKQSSSQSRLSLASPQVSSRGEDTDRTPAPARLPSRLPLLSPPSSYNSSGSKDAKGKGKTRTDNVEDGNKVRPFPMMVDDASENSSASESLKTRPAVKRLSDDVPGDSSSRKKFKTDDALPPPSGNPADSNFDYGDEFDSFFNTGVDHETLCPFCDSRLPKNPTPHLQKLIDDAVRKSKPQPRPTNRLGRKLAMGDYIHICQRHHFEAELLPQAEAKGWPKTIDFSKLEARVFKLKPRLKDILEDVEWKDQLGEDPDTWEMDAESPRALCVFWQETLKEVRSKGSKVAANVKSQFLTFHKTQPG
ncbi:hypothetical protein PQX77_015053 [Marasmius sp. AFHP31]|nr:hypothetical protein PQX77_015053 [Marasmius sp. AFHP31]